MPVKIGPKRLRPDARSDRLDRTMAQLFCISRGEARRLIAAGGAWLNGRRCKVASRPCQPGDELVAYREALSCDESSLPTIVWSDDKLAVVDKPAGLPTGATRESDRGTLEAWAQRQFGARVHLPHRLDRRASGLLLVVVDPALNRAVSDLFASGDLERVYRVGTDAEPPQQEGRIVGTLDGRHAALHYRCVGPRSLEVRLETGRTHQIRRQLASIGCPVAGDPRYGGSPGPLRLRAISLSFVHPTTGGRLRFDAPAPGSFPGSETVGSVKTGEE